MDNYYDKTWKIGELARIFDVNVQLLRHYDKEGLLIPEIRNPDNKWRTYRYDQIYSLGLIRFLRELDCSLDEIGDFMKGRNARVTEEFIHNKIEEAKSRYESLIRMESVIRDRFVMIRKELDPEDMDQITIVSEDEIGYIETGGLEEKFAEELFYLYPTMVIYSGDTRKFAIKISVDDAGIFRDRVQIMPAGRYIAGYHCGAYEDIRDTFDRIRSQSGELLDGTGYVSGEVITINIVDQLIEENRENFVTRVMLKIDAA